MIIDYLSASRLDVYCSCPFKYFLKYHAGLEELNLPSIATHKGNAVHSALEKFVKEKVLVAQTLRDYYAEHRVWEWDNRKPDKGFPHPVEKNCASCKWAAPSPNAGGSFNCTIANKDVSEFDGCPKPNFEDDLRIAENGLRFNAEVYKRKILGVEVPFDVDFGSFRIHGFIDLVTEINSDTIEVQDYKTGNWTKNGGDALQDLQMRMYSIAAKHLFPSYKYVLMTLDYLKKNPVTVIFGPEDDAKTIEFLTDTYQKISNSSDPPRLKSFKCSWCVGYDRCGKMRESYLDKDGKFILPEPTPPKSRRLPMVEEV